MLSQLISMDRLKQNKGQTLVELMIAMSVMSIGFLGVFAVLSQSLGLNRVVANQYIAANLAAEGIEVVKNIADSNTLQAGGVWNRGLESGDFGVQHDSAALNRDWANQSLKFDSATGIYSYGLGAPTNFRRTVSIANITANEMQVKSVVEWLDRGGTKFKVELEDRFFNWRSP